MMTLSDPPLAAPLSSYLVQCNPAPVRFPAQELMEAS